ncbi:MAG TPA: sterol desaturase family protein [Gammaproteobacteria bacterium]|nr:sterol desaturase family protein [Gammaproteobacteria bacterium]
MRLPPIWHDMVLRDAVRWLAYPTIMVGALLLLAALREAGASLAWAPYAAAAIAGVAVVLAERAVPYRVEWQPRGAELLDDGLFLACVQFVVPLALAWTVAWLAQGWIAEHSGALALWPNQWPIAAQLAAKIVLGDFLRYWLHRAAHTWTPLWRLHAVHHAPEKLYTTNVFRFHPAEKTLQFLCDTLPFMLVGIGAEVLGYYFVFYAVSGLFQHSNFDLRLGWLNYLVSGPEVHRWHHSRHVAESNHNYAHSFVVWDLLFGTYFRPRDRTVEDLGLRSRDYPRRFLAQLGAPFARGAP